MARRLQFNVLGPLTVLADGDEVELGRGNERTVLALLALNVGRPLSSDAIVDALWGERPPPTAREMVRNSIARARKRIGEDAVETLPGGYQLRVEADSVDWFRFERLATDGARALERRDPREAFERFEEALSLWRGSPLPELDDVRAGQGAVARLEELRLRVVEDRIDAELELGRSATLVPDLEQLVREHPYRERPLGQLMLALYRCGRQTDALERYRIGRRRLVEDAGLEPSPRLQQLHVSILRHDTTLDLSRPTATEPDGHAPGEPRGRRRIPVAAVAVAAAPLAAAIVVPLLTLGGSAPVALSAQSLAVLDAQSGAALRSRRLSGSPGPVAVSSEAIWVNQRDPASLVEVGTRTMKIERAIPLAAAPYSVASGAGSAWVGNAFFGTLTRVDAHGRPSRAFRPRPGSTGRLPLAYGLGALWVGSQDGTLTRLDPRAHNPPRSIDLHTDPEAVAVGGGSVWVVEASRDGVLRVNPGTGRVVHETPIGERGVSISFGDGAVWVRERGGRARLADRSTRRGSDCVDRRRRRARLSRRHAVVGMGGYAGGAADADRPGHESHRTNDRARPCRRRAGRRRPTPLGRVDVSGRD